MHARFLGPALGCLVALGAAGALAQTTPPAAAPGAPGAAPPAAPLAAAPAPAAAPAQLARIRGTIAKVSAHELVVHTRDGGTADIMLMDPLTVVTLKRVPLSAIKDDTYVGIASRNGPHGTAEALEVLVFPPAMRGVGEGHYGWDLQPGSMMTNAPVTGVVKAKSGRDLTLTYKTGTFTVHVPPTHADRHVRASDGRRPEARTQGVRDCAQGCRRSLGGAAGHRWHAWCQSADVTAVAMAAAGSRDRLPRSRGT